jgi:hypothetical protein
MSVPGETILRRWMSRILRSIRCLASLCRRLRCLKFGTSPILALTSAAPPYTNTCGDLVPANAASEHTRPTTQKYFQTNCSVIQRLKPLKAPTVLQVRQSTGLSTSVLQFLPANFVRGEGCAQRRPSTKERRLKSKVQHVQLSSKCGPVGPSPRPHRGWGRDTMQITSGSTASQFNNIKFESCFGISNGWVQMNT